MDTQTPTMDPNKQESKVPEPPALEIDIRTMESDIKAFKEGGGEVPTAGMQETVATQRQDEVRPGAAPAYTGPEKPMFETPAMPVAPAASQAPSGTRNVVLITVGIVIGVIGLGLLGYFVLFPYLFKLID